jgi:hypothetical protein
LHYTGICSVGLSELAGNWWMYQRPKIFVHSV